MTECSQTEFGFRRLFSPEVRGQFDDNELVPMAGACCCVKSSGAHEFWSDLLLASPTTAPPIGLSTACRS